MQKGTGHSPNFIWAFPKWELKKNSEDEKVEKKDVTFCLRLLGYLLFRPGEL